MPRFPIRLASLLCALALSASCSQFDAHWDSTPMDHQMNPAVPVVGKWEGTWQSDATDYAGHMQAIVIYKQQVVKEKQTVPEYSAELRFRIYELGFDEYTVTLTGTPLPDGRIRIEGKKDLGYFKGGILWLDGIVDPEQDMFYCDYISEKDSGTYKMRRLVQVNQ